MLFALLACTGAHDSAKPQDSGTTDACPVGTHDDGGACLSTITAWEDAGSLTSARDHHVSFVHSGADGAWFFSLAGTDMDGATNLVIDRAPIEADGSLGAFTEAGTLPEGRIGPAFVSLDATHHLVAGGLLDTYDSTTATWILTVGDDGSVQIEDGPPLGATRYHAAAAMWDGYVYVTGGMYQTYSTTLDQYAVDTVERARWDGTSLGAFETVTPMAEATTHHGFFAHEGAVYVVGGGDSSKARTDVLRATVGTDGALGEWTSAGTLPDGRGGMAVTTLGDEVLLVGGMQRLTGGETDTVWRATLQADGTVDDFTELAPLPQERTHSHQAPVHAGWIYSAGGSVMHMDQAEVYRAALE